MKKTTTIIIIVLIVAVSGFMWYRNKTMKVSDGSQSATQDAGSANKANSENAQPAAPGTATDQSGDQADTTFEDNFNATCQNGDWVNIANQTGDAVTLSGKLRKVYPDDETSAQFSAYTYFMEGAEKMALTGNSLAKLDYFEDRDVEAQGVRSANKKEFAVSGVRCAGKETDKNIISQRDKLMSWITANINSIAPQKAKYRKWTVDTVEFVDENNVYVEYYDTAEDDDNVDLPDNVDTESRLLLEISPKADGSFNTKALAYWEMGEDDYVLKTGTDKFEDVVDTNLYQYDPDQKTWERID